MVLHASDPAAINLGYSIHAVDMLRDLFPRNRGPDWILLADDGAGHPIPRDIGEPEPWRTFAASRLYGQDTWNLMAWRIVTGDAYADKAQAYVREYFRRWDGWVDPAKAPWATAWRPYYVAALKSLPRKTKGATMPLYRKIWTAWLHGIFEVLQRYGFPGVEKFIEITGESGIPGFSIIEPEFSRVHGFDLVEDPTEIEYVALKLVRDTTEAFRPAERSLETVVVPMGAGLGDLGRRSSPFAHGGVGTGLVDGMAQSAIAAALLIMEPGVVSRGGVDDPTATLARLLDAIQRQH